ncbi:hypothetical protein [Rhizobium sp. 11515TR]|uniref:hypothetical protein n=1 Tax=Rhizobium sp. 11515TR TaxID=2028343 RepID=UPI0011B70FF0|nr:hypothetical protein [Rhizobium sp. 11515TR]
MQFRLEKRYGEGQLAHRYPSCAGRKQPIGSLHRKLTFASDAFVQVGPLFGQRTERSNAGDTNNGPSSFDFELGVSLFRSMSAMLNDADCTKTGMAVDHNCDHTPEVRSTTTRRGYASNCLLGNVVVDMRVASVFSKRLPVEFR